MLLPGLGCALNSDDGKRRNTSAKEKRREAAEQREGWKKPIPPEGVEAEGGFTLFEVRDGIARNAVCNNGQPYRYFFRKGSGGHAEDWIIGLKGGGACASVEACAKRWEGQTQFMRPAGTSQVRAGLYSDDAVKNKDFYDWNQIFLWYWIERRTTDPEVGGSTPPGCATSSPRRSIDFDGGFSVVAVGGDALARMKKWALEPCPQTADTTVAVRRSPEDSSPLGS